MKEIMYGVYRAKKYVGIERLEVVEDRGGNIVLSHGSIISKNTFARTTVKDLDEAIKMARDYAKTLDTSIKETRKSIKRLESDIVNFKNLDKRAI